jgi:acid stress-induced BolA-like protein IbaG/YrbA
MFESRRYPIFVKFVAVPGDGADFKIGLFSKAFELAPRLSQLLVLIASFHDITSTSTTHFMCAYATLPMTKPTPSSS